jgi:hypothetical protein
MSGDSFDLGKKRKSKRRKSKKRKSMKRKSMKRKSMKRKSMKRKSMKRKSMKRIKSRMQRGGSEYQGGDPCKYCRRWNEKAADMRVECIDEKCKRPRGLIGLSYNMGDYECMCK